MTQHLINSEPALDEEWRPVPGLESTIEASSFGRIRTKPRTVNTCYGATRLLAARVLSTRPTKSGYARIHSGIGETQLVHRLVALAFLPNPDNLPIINHIDGRKGNNRPANLEWCTQAQNLAHAIETGLSKVFIPGRGDDSPAAKLTEEQVREIKRALRHGSRSIDLAREFNVCKGTIGEIKAGRSWGHVT